MISCLPLASILPKYRRLLVLLQCCCFSAIVRISFPSFTFQWLGLCFILPLCYFPALLISAIPLFFRVQQNSFLIRQSLVTCTRHVEITTHPCEWHPWVLVIHLHTRCMPSLKTNVLDFLDVESAASLKSWKEIDATGWFLGFPVSFQPSQTGSFYDNRQPFSQIFEVTPTSPCLLLLSARLESRARFHHGPVTSHVETAS